MKTKYEEGTEEKKRRWEVLEICMG